MEGSVSDKHYCHSGKSYSGSYNHFWGVHVKQAPGMDWREFEGWSLSTFAGLWGLAEDGGSPLTLKIPSHPWPDKQALSIPPST
jgi:hypothetical protein